MSTIKFELSHILITISLVARFATFQWTDQARAYKIAAFGLARSLRVNGRSQIKPPGLHQNARVRIIMHDNRGSVNVTMYYVQQCLLRRRLFRSGGDRGLCVDGGMSSARGSASHQTVLPPTPLQYTNHLF